MRSWIQKLLPRSAPPSTPLISSGVYSPAPDSLDVPSPEIVLSDPRAQHLVELLRRDYPFDRPQFEADVLPLVRQVAAFYGPLPSSQSSHHSYVNGATIHTLEVMHYYLHGSGKLARPQNLSGEMNTLYERDLCRAGLLAAALHDAGKPETDLRIWLAGAATKEWDPLYGTLWDFVSEAKSFHIRYRWCRNRHRKHERLPLLFLGSWMKALGLHFPPAVKVVLVDAVENHPDSKIAELVKQADRQSSRADKAHRSQVNSPKGPEQDLLFGINELIRSGSEAWEINRPGSIVYRTPAGLLFVWPRMGRELTQFFTRRGIRIDGKYGELGILEQLVDCGLIVTYPGEEETLAIERFRPACIGDEKKPLHGVRMRHENWLTVEQLPDQMPLTHHSSPHGEDLLRAGQPDPEQADSGKGKEGTRPQGEKTPTKPALNPADEKVGLMFFRQFRGRLSASSDSHDELIRQLDGRQALAWPQAFEDAGQSSGAILNTLLSGGLVQTTAEGESEMRNSGDQKWVLLSDSAPVLLPQTTDTKRSDPPARDLSVEDETVPKSKKTQFQGKGGSGSLFGKPRSPAKEVATEPRNDPDSLAIEWIRFLVGLARAGELVHDPAGSADDAAWRTGDQGQVEINQATFYAFQGHHVPASKMGPVALSELLAATKVGTPLSNGWSRVAESVAEKLQLNKKEEADDETEY